MSLLGSLVDGARVPLHTLNRQERLEREADAFMYPVQIHTGKAESEWLGSWLLKLSAESGAWHAVPWRMLRNEYMSYGQIRRLQLKNEQKVPKLFESEPVVTYVMGGDTPPEELLIGVKDMLDRKLAEIVSIEDEDYLVPTNALLKCAPETFDLSASQ